MIELRPRAGTHAARSTRPGSPLKTIAGLVAVYAPLVLVFVLDHRHLLDRAYLVAAIWAAEAIVWYWLDGHTASPRSRAHGAGWHAEPY